MSQKVISTIMYSLLACLVFLAHMQPVVECFSISNYYQGKTMFSSLSQLNMMADDSNTQKSPASGYEDKKKVIIITMSCSSFAYDISYDFLKLSILKNLVSPQRYLEKSRWYSKFSRESYKTNTVSIQ
jgi:hypothetical protein